MITLWLSYRNLKMRLELNDKVTVIVGNSATGKSSIHRMLTSGEATFRYKISDSRYTGVEYLSREKDVKDNLNSGGVLIPYVVYIIDEGKLEITDEVATIIQKSVNTHIIITARTKLGKLNYSLSAVKILETQENGVTVLKNYIEL